MSDPGEPATPALRDPGSAVLLRDVWRGQAWTTWAVTVVLDEPGRTALYRPIGTPGRAPLSPDGRPYRRIEQLHGYETRAWRGRHALHLYQHGDPFSVWCWWDPDWNHIGWYVNLERPWTRTTNAFETMDHELDIEVAIDGSWSWKDEELLAEWVTGGAHTPAEAEQFRRDGERVVRELIEPWSGPFAEGWETWRPDPSWELPTMPADWASCQHPET